MFENSGARLLREHGVVEETGRRRHADLGDRLTEEAAEIRRQNRLHQNRVAQAFAVRFQ